MLGIPRSYHGRVSNLFPSTPGSTSDIGNLITADGTSHVKGAWDEFISSTTEDWYGFWMSVSTTSSSAAQTDMLLDLAIGAASSEQIILHDWMCGYKSQGNSAFEGFYFPIFIPKGSRLTGRIQALIASDTCRVLISGVPKGSAPQSALFVGCDAYGITAASSNGTAHTAGDSGAESTDATIGTTTRNYGAVMMGMSLPDTAASGRGYHWELTIGGQTRAEWFVNVNTDETIKGPFPNAPVYVSIPNSTALQIQGECSGTAEADTTVAFYCFY